jgi:hypothetical protein
MKLVLKVACVALALSLLVMPGNRAPAQSGSEEEGVKLQQWENQDGKISCSGVCPGSMCCPEKAPPLTPNTPG